MKEVTIRIPDLTLRNLAVLLVLGSLAAGEVQESVKFSSREKLAAGEVFEGRLELLPCRGQRAAPLKGGGQLGIEHGQAWS